MEKKTVNQQIIANDVLRYKKNKLASMLALLGLVFNCLYFMILYAFPRAEYTTIKIGVSVIITLIVLLTIFLSSEGVKGYNKKFSIVLLVVAAFQILRIFGYPLDGVRNNTLIGADSTHTVGYFGIYPKSSGMFFALMTIYLAASAGCLIASAVIGWIYAARLEKFQKQLDLGEVSIENAIIAVEAEEETAAALAATQAETVAEVKTEQPAEVVEVKKEQPIEAVAAEAEEAEKTVKPAQAKKPAQTKKTATNAKPKTSGTKSTKTANTDREVK
ncbi:MAG: hypothetical protein K2K60_00475 [Clostridia bacterium]|nr:hypothetical protein [Clostridia bacterium]